MEILKELFGLMKEPLVYNLILVMVFAGIAFIVRLGDMFNGAVIATKKHEFSWDIFLKGFLFLLNIIVIVCCIVIAITALNVALPYFNIEIVNQEAINGLTTLGVAAIFISYAVVKIKDLIEKLRTIMSIKEEDVIELKFNDEDTEEHEILG